MGGVDMRDMAVKLINALKGTDANRNIAGSDATRNIIQPLEDSPETVTKTTTNVETRRKSK